MDQTVLTVDHGALHAFWIPDDVDERAYSALNAAYHGHQDPE